VGIDHITLLAIALMALATYATRAGELWLANRFDLSERAGAWLDAIRARSSSRSSPRRS
jgi:uncharacterized membrane protein